jgi:hypothetical protein
VNLKNCIIFSIGLILIGQSQATAQCCSNDQDVYFCGIKVNHLIEQEENWTIKWAVYSKTKNELTYVPEQQNCIIANYPRNWRVEYTWEDGTHDYYHGDVSRSWYNYSEHCSPVGQSWAEEEMVNYAEDPLRLPVTVELYSICGVSGCDSTKRLVQSIYVDSTDYLGDWPDTLPPPWADCKHKHIRDLHICDNEYKHLTSGDCLTRKDKIYLEAELTSDGEYPDRVLADVFIRPFGHIGHIWLEPYSHEPADIIYRGVSDFHLRDLDPDSSGTWVDVDAYYLYNCSSGQEREGYVHTGLQMSDLQLKIELPPTGAHIPCAAPYFCGATIPFKGKLDGCDAYLDHEIQWDFIFHYKRDLGTPANQWSTTYAETALTDRYIIEHLFNTEDKHIPIGGLTEIKAKSFLRGERYDATPCTIYVVGCAIPDDSITNRLDSLYPPRWEAVFHRTCPTKNLLTGICFKESTYRQFIERELYGVNARWPNPARSPKPSEDGSHVGLMMVPHKKMHPEWAWNWRANINEGLNCLSTGLSQSKSYETRVRALFRGLYHQILPDTAFEDNGEFFYQYGAYALREDYGIERYWFLSYAIPSNIDTMAIENSWIPNNCYWLNYGYFWTRLIIRKRYIEGLRGALRDVIKVREYLR